jgi:hypothetical protein
VLVVAQVALAVILLTTSTLAFKSVRGMYAQPLGMSVDRLLIFGMEFNDVLFPDPAGAGVVASSTREALAACPTSRASRWSVPCPFSEMADRSRSRLMSDKHSQANRRQPRWSRRDAPTHPRSRCFAADRCMVVRRPGQRCGD